MRGIEALIGDSKRSESMKDNTKDTSIEDLMVKMSDIMNILTEMTLSKDEKYQEEVTKEIVPEGEPGTIEPIVEVEEESKEV